METRKLPATSPRVETGPVQFGNDWTGVFIRGDNALHYADAIQIILAADDAGNPFARAAVNSLAKILSFTDERMKP